MKNLAMRFVRDETGATAIEYGLIVAAISVSIMAVIQGIGSRLNTTFTSVAGRAQIGMTGRAVCKRLRPFAGAFVFCRRRLLFAPLLHGGQQRAVPAPEDFQISNYTEDFQTI